MNQPQMYEEINNLEISQKDVTRQFVLDNYLNLIKWYSDSETILDVGVGDGKFTVDCLIPQLPKGFGKLVGSDISENMINFAREKYKIPNIEFKQLDIGTDRVPLDFLNGFNHIFSFYTLHWVRNQRKAFANMHKILKPGGDILLMFLVKNPFDGVYESLSKRPRWKQYDHTRLISPYSGSDNPKLELEQILAETGFCNVVCQIKERSKIFSTLKNLQDFFLALNPHVSKMSEEERRNYIVDFSEDMKSRNVYSSKIVEEKEVFQVNDSIFIVYASKAL